MTKKELAGKIKGSRLYKLYHNPTDEISRDAPEGVNATGQATDRMMELQRMVKCATVRETDFPPELRNDADELRELVQTGIVTLFSDSEDGEISPADFKTVFAPLAGMTEGMLAALNYDDPDKMMSLRSMKAECAGKAFYKQLKRTLLESSTLSGTFGAVGKERMFRFGKALSSFGTHLFIKAEKGGHLPTGLVEEVGELIGSLNRKAARGVFEFEEEVGKVRSWGLVEDAMSPVTRSRPVPSNRTKGAPGLPSGTRSTAKHPPGSARVKGPADDRTGYKPGGGQRSEVVPPQLDQSPGNPPNLKPEDGPEPRQKGDWMDGGARSTIDGQKTNRPANESVEFLVRIPEKVGCMEWNIRLGDKVIGEARRRVFLGGSEHRAEIKASELATALNESAGIPGDGIKVVASDIFELQLRVVEEMNKVAGRLGQSRRFTIAR